MLSFFRPRRAERSAAEKIGAQLDAQFKDAASLNMTRTEARIPTFFTIGYIAGFVHFSFYLLGFEEKAALDRQLKRICDRIIPDRLYEMFARLMTEMDEAEIRGDLERRNQFQAGYQAGGLDADVFFPRDFPDDSVKAIQLRTYLLGAP